MQRADEGHISSEAPGADKDEPLPTSVDGTPPTSEGSDPRTGNTHYFGQDRAKSAYSQEEWSGKGGTPSDEDVDEILRWQNVEADDEPYVLRPLEDEGEDDGTWPDCAFEATGGNPSKVALLIAIGVLAGENPNLISDAATRLCEHLTVRAPEPQAREGEFALDVTSSRDRLLKSFRAMVTPSDDFQGERLGFRSPHNAVQVLLHALNQFSSEIRADVVTWLTELGSSRDRRARLAVGRAYGATGGLQGEVLRDRVIDAWRTADFEHPLDALDACFAVMSRGSAKAAVDAAVDEMSRRSSLDDVFALGALARGQFGAEHPDKAFALLARLLRLNREDAFGVALRGYFFWLFAGKRHPVHAGRVLCELDAVGARGSEPEKIQKAWLIMAFLRRIGRGRDYELAVFEANLSSTRSVAAAGRLLNYVFFFDHRIKEPPIRTEARALARSLFRAGLDSEAIRRITLPLFNAALDQAASDQAAILREGIAAWRSAKKSSETKPRATAGNDAPHQDKRGQP